MIGTVYFHAASHENAGARWGRSTSRSRPVKSHVAFVAEVLYAAGRATPQFTMVPIFPRAVNFFEGADLPKALQFPCSCLHEKFAAAAFADQAMDLTSDLPRKSQRGYSVWS